MAFYYFEQIKKIENVLNTMQNKPKMQLTFGFYYQKMHLKIIKNMINMSFITAILTINCLVVSGVLFTKALQLAASIKLISIDKSPS